MFTVPIRSSNRVVRNIKMLILSLIGWNRIPSIFVIKSLSRLDFLETENKQGNVSDTVDL